VYFITSRLDPAKLKDFYGAGALPINYPNPLDQSRGKTGSGIWLHGTPPDQFSRAPQATDGCLVLANPDLERILRTVEPRSTPVVIARQLQWVQPHSVAGRAQVVRGRAQRLAHRQDRRRHAAPAGLLCARLPELPQEAAGPSGPTMLQAEPARWAAELQLKDKSAYLRWKTRPTPWW
jgi:hypothetical protein